MNEQEQIQLEAEILGVIDSGLTQSEIPVRRIAARMHRDVQSVELALNILMSALNCTSQRTLVTEARQRGLLPSQRRAAA